MTYDQRIKFWWIVIGCLEATEDLNTKAVMLQEAIAAAGPVPDELGPNVRRVLKQTTEKIV